MKCKCENTKKSTSSVWKTDREIQLKSPLIQNMEELLQALNNQRLQVLRNFDENAFLSEIEETIASLPPLVLEAFLDAAICSSYEWNQENVSLFSWAMYDSLSPASLRKRMILAQALGKYLAVHKKDFFSEIKKYLSPEYFHYYTEALEESFGFFVKSYVEHSENLNLREDRLRELLTFLEELGEKVWLDFCFSLPQEGWNPVLKREVIQRCIQLDSLESITLLERLVDTGTPESVFLNYLQAPEDYLRYYAKRRVLSKLGEEMNWDDVFARIPKNSTLYLTNLMDSTSPSAKIHTIEMLLQKTAGDEKKNYDLIVHLINVLKNEMNPHVLEKTALSLIQLSPSVSLQQRSELIDELLRSVWKDDSPSPQMLRVLAYYLHFQGGEEFKKWSPHFSRGIKSGQESRSVSLLWEVYQLLLIAPDTSSHEDVLIHLLLNGMGHYKETTASMGLHFFLKLLEEPKLTPEKKGRMLSRLLPKIHSILQSEHHGSWLYVVMRRHFLVGLFAFFDSFPPEKYISSTSFNRVAFFPGTFDPFSSAHKAIAIEVASMGYEVYLAIDEFSWSKATTANCIRREIVRLSIADEFHLHIFPEDFSVNIANPKDLAELKDIFAGREITMLMGGDVILHASAYDATRTDTSIHTFPHILFTRMDSQKVQRRADALQLDVRLLDLGYLSPVSSSRIREGIGLQKDISGLIDPMAKDYIYEHDLYAVDERVKHSLKVQPRGLRILDLASPDELISFEKRARETLLLKESASAPRVLELSMASGEYGFILFHWIRLKDLHKEMTTAAFYHHVREHAIGRLLCIDRIYHEGDQRFCRRLLQEFFRYVLPKDYTYCIYIEEKKGEFEALLSSMGFLRVDADGMRLYYVDMSHPCTLSLDVNELILQPYEESSRVQTTLSEARSSLREEIVSMYPGELLLSMDQADIYDILIPLITAENEVPSAPQTPKKLGENLCVPFGEIFKKRTLPNTITKSMHTERFFYSDYDSFTIEHFPGYLRLRDQVRMVRSFDRPLLLVDDVLHKGYRLRTLAPLLKENGLTTKKLFVGILSGNGKSVADELRMEVESAYFIPRLRLWFQESKLYPYIGGDSLHGELSNPHAGMIPSVNLLYPYTGVELLKNESPQKMMRFSETCLQASLHVLKALEEEYFLRRQRLLTLDRLSEVLRHVRYPAEHWKRISGKRMPSELIKRDIQLLRRLRGNHESEK